MRFFFTIVFLVCASIAFSQKKSDSLLRELKSAKTVEEKTDLYYLLGTELMGQDPEKSFQYLKQGLLLATGSGDIIRQSRGYSGLGSLQYMKSDFSGAILLFQKSLALAFAAGDMIQGARQYSNIGTIYDISGRYPEAAQNYFKALRIFEYKNDSAGRAFVLNNLGIVFIEIGQPYQALEFYNQALQFKNSLNDTLGMASTLNNIGTVYESELHDLENAALFYSKSLSLYKLKDNLYGVAFATHNLGKVKSDMGLFNEAIPLFEKAIELRVALSDFTGEMQSRHLLARQLLAIGRVDQAYTFAEPCLKQLNTLETPKERADLLETLVLISEARSDFKNAYLYEKNLSILRDSLLSSENSATINELNIQYQTQQKEQKIIELKLAKQSEQQKRYYLSLLLLALIVIIFVSLLFFRQRQKVLKEKNKRLKLDMDFARAETKRREKDLHDLTRSMLRQTELLGNLQVAVEKLSSENEKLKTDMQPVSEMISNSLVNEKGWEAFQMRFEQTYPGFLQKLKSNFPEITYVDQRLCALLKLNLSTKEIANLQNIGIEAVNKQRNRLRKKLNMDAGSDFLTFFEEFKI
ncbi:MAG: hypothetical protein CVU11_02490 [Bacteroidetes bacterium HGW-Bacteroidetes-6]|jgi:tetratricopeptide (TPR) repeat protein|nr:MAG: hypothetical protein CVU11_02490 [Bacteroidetes bacterium HGW-Bacteroidetes-6]